MASHLSSRAVGVYLASIIIAGGLPTPMAEGCLIEGCLVLTAEDCSVAMVLVRLSSTVPTVESRR